MNCVNAFQFSYLHTFYKLNQITLKPSLALKLNLALRSSSIKWEINIPLWTHMEHKGWGKDGKAFIRCCIIALRFWDQFNASFPLLNFSTYKSMKIWHLYLKKVERNNMGMHLRLLFTYLRQICPCTFCVFQKKVNKAVNILCTLPEWTRNDTMLQYYKCNICIVLCCVLKYNFHSHVVFTMILHHIYHWRIRWQLLDTLLIYYMVPGVG